MNVIEYMRNELDNNENSSYLVCEVGQEEVMDFIEANKKGLLSRQIEFVYRSGNCKLIEVVGWD